MDGNNIGFWHEAWWGSIIQYSSGWGLQIKLKGSGELKFSWSIKSNHGRGRISTVIVSLMLPMPPKIKKKYYSKIKWIGTVCRGGNFSSFGGKVSTLEKFYFRFLDPRVCQIWAQICKVEIFPLWWKIFHFQKVANKKICIPKSHELGHSE